MCYFFGSFLVCTICTFLHTMHSFDAFLVFNVTIRNVYYFIAFGRSKEWVRSRFLGKELQRWLSTHFWLWLKNVYVHRHWYFHYFSILHICVYSCCCSSELDFMQTHFFWHSSTSEQKYFFKVKKYKPKE